MNASTAVPDEATHVIVIVERHIDALAKSHVNVDVHCSIDGGAVIDSGGLEFDGGPRTSRNGTLETEARGVFKLPSGTNRMAIIAASVSGEINLPFKPVVRTEFQVP